MTLENVIKDIERHCNNYFNPSNDPASPIREHTPEFLELAGHIHQFAENPYRFTGNGPWQADGPYASWQTFFKDELAAYKRAKFI